MTGKRLFLFVGAFLFSAGVSYLIVLVRREVRVDLPAPTHVDLNPPALPPPPPPPPVPPPAPSVPVVEITPERVTFDKAIAYISSQQESDGHWSAEKTGASKDYSGINGDVAVTAICASALLDTNQGRNQNRAAVTRVKHAMEWLSARVNADGKVCDESGPGEPVMAQIFAAFAFLQATELSNKPAMREISERICRYTIKNLSAKAGGFGAVKDAAAVRSDITAMATVLFNQSRVAYISFADPPGEDSEKNHAAALELEKKIKAGLEALRCEPKTGGTFARSADNLKTDWNGTIAGLLNEKAFGMEPKEYVSGLEYIFGVTYDEFRLTKSEKFLTLEKNLTWGEKGEGYEALTLLQGSMLFFNEYGPARAEWATWTNLVMKMLVKNQAADGSWPVAGNDARWGKLWRAAIHARVINLLVPPQLPPPAPQAPPPDEPESK